MKTFAQHYTENYQAVLTHVVTYVKDVAVAEDITSDAFEKALKHFDEFNSDRANFQTWVKFIAKNTMLDNFRNKYGRNTTSQENYVDSEGEYVIQPMTDDSADSETLNAELRKEILTAIRSLKPAYRKVAILRFVQEKEYNEIAETLQIPMGSVKGMVSRARATLQTVLA